MRQSIPDQQSVSVAVNLPALLPPVMVDATLTRQALFKLVRLVGHGVSGEIQLSARSTSRAVELLISHPTACPDCQEADWRIAELLFEQQGGSLAQINTSEGIQVVVALPRLEQCTVLVVDDNAALHQLFERYLTPNNYTLLHAFNGAEALHIADASQPDFITLDVMMASVDGWQVLRDLQLNPHTAAIPVIVCSVLREPELALSLGAKAYLKKPVERLQLQQVLEQLRAGHPASGAGS
jgi:CheY-like chemotaxis protein